LTESSSLVGGPFFGTQCTCNLWQCLVQ